MRPDYVTGEHLDYLDRLRESGVTNMFGSPAYVAARFGITFREAGRIVQYWMDTFGKDDR